MGSNPWVRLAPLARRSEVSPTYGAAGAVAAPTSPAMPVRRPQPQLTRPARRLPQRHMDQPTRFVLGVHGGAAESLVAGLLGWAAAEHAWPVRLPTLPSDWPEQSDRSHSNAVVLTCRSDHAGLQAARDAIREWAASTIPGVDLLGLVVVADGPGRLPRPLQQLAAVAAGGVPHCWHLPWLAELRLGASPPHDDRAVRRLVDHIAATALARTAATPALAEAELDDLQADPATPLPLTLSPGGGTS